MSGKTADPDSSTKASVAVVSNGTMSTLVLAAEELVKAACSHMESTSLAAANDTIESLKDLTLKSSATVEKSVELMKETLKQNLDSMKQSMAVNLDSNKQSLADSLESNKQVLEASLNKNKQMLVDNLDVIKQFDTKIITLNSNMASLKEELTNLNKTLEKQAMTHRLEWALANFDKISDSFTFYSYEYKGKSFDYTKSSSATLIKDILLAFLRGEGCDINYRTMSRQNREEGEKQFREAISKEIQAIIGQKPRIAVAERGYAIYYS